jgi:hypothetical protein
MINKQIFALIILAAMLVLAGCQVATVSSPKPDIVIMLTPIHRTEKRPQINQSTPSPTLSPLQKFTETPSPTVAPTAIPTNLPTDLPELRLKNNCLDILPTLPPDANRSGRLVLHGLDGTYLKDMATGVVELLPQNKKVGILEGSAVSTDGRWLVYDGAASLAATKYSYVVRSADGKQQFEFTSEDVDHAGLGYWLDNQHLALHRINTEGLDWVVIYNPFTKEQQVIKPDYPDILQDDWEFLSWPTSLTTYSPSLTKVVYLAGKLFSSQIVLWDRETHHSILEISDFEYAYKGPMWSPDGKRFVFVKSLGKKIPDREEFFIVDWDGKIEQLTHLNEQLDSVRIYDRSWSPNGQYIAFWLNGTLAVVDTSSGEVTNYCISASRSDALPPVWSRDSQHLAIGVADPGEEISRTVLVDIIDDYAAIVAEDVAPEGWMISP